MIGTGIEAEIFDGAAGHFRRTGARGFIEFGLHGDTAVIDQAGHSLTFLLRIAVTVIELDLVPLVRVSQVKPFDRTLRSVI